MPKQFDFFSAIFAKLTAVMSAWVPLDNAMGPITIDFPGNGNNIVSNDRDYHNTGIYFPLFKPIK